MKTVFPIAVFILVLLSSCGINVQKRLYRDGFYVATLHKSPDRSAICLTHSKTAEVTCDHVAQNADDSIPQDLSKKSAEDHPALLQDSTIEKPFELLEVNKMENHKIKSQSSVYAPQNEIRKIERLNNDATACLKASILVFPIAFLTLSGALIMSLIALRKIRKLTRAGRIPTDQEKNLANQKHRARKTAWISGAILMLLLIGFIIFFCVSGPLINAGNIPIGL